MAVNVKTDKEITSQQLAWQAIRAYLTTKKHQINEEVRYYPPPIPACDAQFNYLLAERAKLSQLLWQLGTMSQTNSSKQERQQWLVAFLEFSSDLEPSVAQAVQQVLDTTD